MSKIKKSQIEIGRWVRVRFTDVGVRDGVIVDKGYNRIELLSGNVKSFIEPEQIIEIGPSLKVPKF